MPVWANRAARLQSRTHLLEDGRGSLPWPWLAVDELLSCATRHADTDVFQSLRSTRIRTIQCPPPRYLALDFT